MGNVERRSSKRGLVLAVLLVFSPSLPSARAQFDSSNKFELDESVQLDLVDSSTLAHLEQVKAFIADQQWDEAVETLRQVTQRDGERVIALSDGLFVTVREYGHLQVATLPPPALELYRDRVDPLARRWYEEAVAARDEAKLVRIVDDLFPSTWGDDALLLLGEMALERGEYRRARGYWYRIRPELRPLAAPGGADREQPVTWVAYPDSDLDPAAVAARLVLVSILEGMLDLAEDEEGEEDEEDFEDEFEAFRRMHPDAEGQLAGRKVNYAEKLDSLLAASKVWPQADPPPGWPTFAGSPQRYKPLPPAVRLAGPAWKSHIALGEPLEADADIHRQFGYPGRRVAEDYDQLLSYHPLVVGDLLLYSNKRGIYAFNLHTGLPAWNRADAEEPGRIYYLEDRPEFATLHRGQGALGAPRFTMTAHAGRLYARVGDPLTSRRQEQEGGRGSHWLVCLDLEAEGKLLWKIKPTPGGENWSFDGAPLSDGRRVYVAMRRSDVRPQAYVACFDAESGDLVWRRYVCAAQTPARGMVDENTHNLLTMAEGTIYFNTNLGAVAAVRTEDGQIEWISLYPRASHGDLSQPAAHLFRDLTPCLYHRGVLYVAPQDSERIFAIDAASGEIAWRSAACDAIHLLGVSGSNLVASGHCLWWFDIHSGKVMRQFPENEKTGPRGRGRGVLVGDQVYWPTRDRIRIFDAQQTVQSQEPISLATYGAQGGNLLVIDGYLLIAGSDTLYGFSQFPRQRRELEREVARNPDQAAPYFRLAQCEEAVENWGEAVRLYHTALDLAKPQERYEQQALPWLISERLQRLLFARADAAARQDDWDRVIEQVQLAVESLRSPPHRAAAIRKLGEVLEAAGRPIEAARELKRLLDDDTLSKELIRVTPHWSVEARRFAAEHIARLNAPHDARSELDSSAAIEPLSSDSGDEAAAAVEKLAVSDLQVPEIPLQVVKDIPLSGPVLLPHGNFAHGDTVLLLGGDDRVACFSIADRRGRWLAPLTDKPRWAAREGDRILVATNKAIVAIHERSGAVLWRWQPSKKADMTRSLGPFAFQPGSVFAMVDRENIAALDTATGEVFWTYRAENQTFGRHLHVSGGRLLFQQRSPQDSLQEPYESFDAIVVDASTGLVLKQLPSNTGEWLDDPIDVGPRAVLLVAGNREVQRLEVGEGRLRWTRRPVEASPTFRPDVVYRNGKLLLLTTDHQLVRIDPLDGSLLWSEPAELGRQILSHPRHLMAIDEGAVYVPNAGKLRAIDLATGNLLWKTDLGEPMGAVRRTWRTQRIGPYVAACPLEFGKQTGVRLVLVDPDDGKLVYRSRPIVAPPGKAELWWAGGAALIASADHLWVLAAGPEHLAAEPVGPSTTTGE